MVYVSKTNMAADAIRSLIESGEVGPGDRVDVRRVAASLEMSITPVREALRILQAEGFLDYDEHRSISVMELSASDISELYLLRSQLEGLASQQAAAVWDEKHAALLERASQAFAAAVEAQDGPAARAANREFHFTIYGAARSRFIEPIISRLWGQFAWSDIWSIPGRMQRSVSEHEEIARALQTGDGGLVASLLVAHIRGSQESITDQRDGSQCEPR